SVVGFLCAAVDPAIDTLQVSPRAKAAASRWLFRQHRLDDPARLAAWVSSNGGDEALARAGADAEESFGGLRSVDRIRRFGGIQNLERALAPGSVAPWPLQQTPGGPALLVSDEDIDSSDTLACLAQDGSVWTYSFAWDEWTRSSDSVRTFVTRVALWGHPHEAPTHVCRSSCGRALADALGLDEVAEASDGTGTFFAGSA